jgi:polar amino acid transport system substrate-binding protein
MKKATNVIVIMLILSFMLISCGRSGWGADGPPTTFSPNDFNGKRIGMLSGSSFVEFCETLIPGGKAVYFRDVFDALEAMKQGKVDAIYDDVAALRLLAASNPGLKLLYPYVTSDKYGIITAKENDYLLDRLNEFISIIQADGTYEDMIDRWLSTAEQPAMPKIPDGQGQVLHFGTTGIVSGFTFFREDELAGLDVEFALRFALFMDRKLDITVMEFAGLIPAVQSGKIDFAATLFTITEEREQIISFTNPYYTGGSAIAVWRAK